MEFADLDRENNEFLKEFNRFRPKTLNSLRNSMEFADLDRENTEFLQEFNRFRLKTLNSLREFNGICRFGQRKL